MAEWCELWDGFKAESSYYTMPCHWYQFSVLGQFIPCGVAHAVSCSKTIRSASRQEYNACKSLSSLLREISCTAERHLISLRWAEDSLRHHVESHVGADNVFGFCSTVQLLKHCSDERYKKFKSARWTNTGLQQVRTWACWIFNRRM